MADTYTNLMVSTTQTLFERAFANQSRQTPFFLYDSDCGVCTQGSHFFKRLLGNRINIVPMHIPELEELGMKRIPEEYWISFHIVQNDTWTTEGEAILELAGLFPMGGIVQKIAAFPPIFAGLKWFLSKMQQTRKVECSVEF